MPWLDIRPMDQKIGFIKRALTVRRGEFAGLCRAYGIARKTGYKWLGRYRSAGTLTALKEQSRRPRQSPQRILPALEQRILELRVPDGWGARKIAHCLQRDGVTPPALSTVHEILRRGGPDHPAAGPAAACL